MRCASCDRLDRGTFWFDGAGVCRVCFTAWRHVLDGARAEWRRIVGTS